MSLPNRVQELAEAWEEGVLHRPLALRGAALGGGQTDFRTAVGGDPTGLFGTVRGERNNESNTEVLHLPQEEKQ